MCKKDKETRHVSSVNYYERFGPEQTQDGIWRINFEAYTLTNNGDIVKFIKLQRIRWLGNA